LTGGALFSLEISILRVECQWQASVKQAQLECSETFTNPLANGKLALVISLNIESVQQGKKFKNHPQSFPRPGFFILPQQQKPD